MPFTVTKGSQEVLKGMATKTEEGTVIRPDVKITTFRRHVISQNIIDLKGHVFGKTKNVGNVTDGATTSVDFSFRSRKSRYGNVTFQRRRLAAFVTKAGQDTFTL